jgi:hypothetical protein
MALQDVLGILHPAIAVAFVFPLIGIVSRAAWQVRQRRLAAASGQKSKIPPTVGLEHVEIGRWLTGSVVGVSLVAFAFILFVAKLNILDPKAWADKGSLLALQLAFFAVTIAALVCLYRSTAKHWRAIFATLSGMGFTIIAAQDGIYRRDHEWWVSHFYYGTIAALLMIFALAILPEIYRNKTWRNVHIAANVVALLLFIGLGFTGSRDLLELPLSWQRDFVFSNCNEASKTCTAPAPQPPAAPAPSGSN